MKNQHIIKNNLDKGKPHKGRRMAPRPSRGVWSLAGLIHTFPGISASHTGLKMPPEIRPRNFRKQCLYV